MYTCRAITSILFIIHCTCMITPSSTQTHKNNYGNECAHTCTCTCIYVHIRLFIVQCHAHMHPSTHTRSIPGLPPLPPHTDIAPYTPDPGSSSLRGDMCAGRGLDETKTGEDGLIVMNSEEGGVILRVLTFSFLLSLLTILP